MMAVPQGWEAKPLSDFFKLKSGDTKPADTDKQGLFGVYGGNGIIGYSNHYNNDVSTLVIGRVGEYCGCIYHVHKCWITDNALLIDKKISNFDITFMYFLLTFLNLNQYKSETGQPLLNQTIIGKIMVPLVPLLEQQKIASILSGIDRAIEATQMLIDKEKMIKKALMADLLNHGIDEQGRIRTPQTHCYVDSLLGMIPEGWEVQRLGELGEFKNGINKSKEDFGFGVPFVNLQDIFGKWSISSDHFDLVNADENEIKNYNLVSGDVLFVRSSVKASGVGLTALVREDMYSTVYSGFVIRFRSKPNLYATPFKQYCFHEESFRQRLLQKATASANSNINQESLASLLVLLPTVVEQERIATILFAQDRKIETEETNLAKLQNLKKGLMRDLLSGKVRVKV